VKRRHLPTILGFYVRNLPPSKDARSGERMMVGLSAFLRRFVLYPSEYAQVAHALWCVHTHLMDRWEPTPRLAFRQPSRHLAKPGRWRLPSCCGTCPRHKSWQVLEAGRQAGGESRADRDHPSLLPWAYVSRLLIRPRWGPPTEAAYDLVSASKLWVS
jgi:hypothetical protein